MWQGHKTPANRTLRGQKTGDPGERTGSYIIYYIVGDSMRDHCASEKQGEKREKMCSLTTVKAGPVRTDNWQLRACAWRLLRIY